MAAIAVSIPPAEGATFSYEKGVAVATAIIAWIWAEASSHVTIVHPQDVKLFQSAHQLLQRGFKFLKEHSFGDSFHEQSVRCFFEFYDGWKGPEHSFSDKKIEAAWSSLRAATSHFTNLMGKNCGNLSNNQNIMTVKTLTDIQQGKRSERTIKAAADLNDAADIAAEKWDQFVSLALKRLKTAV